jgi:organic radical activating enzyme
VIFECNIRKAKASVQLIVLVKKVDKEPRAVTLHGGEPMICLSDNIEKLAKSGTDDVLEIH